MAAMTTKDELRRHYAQLRKTLPTLYRENADQQITAKVLSIPQVQQAHTMCCYVSHQEEINTHTLINALLLAGKQVVIPKVAGKNLTLHAISSLTQCVPGFKGILEPIDSNPIIDPSTVEVFIVVGLAFDSKGYRLGYGKGFTDRLLKNTPGYKIGVCYSDQLAFELPHEPHDIPVNLVISEQISLKAPES